jgi:pimeloyl-ACP methyl ester carboxylesterase
MQPQPTDLMLSGKRVHVWIGGTGPALLLLHSAWGDASMSWAPVWNELSRFFTVLAPDMPGFGASDPLDLPTLSANARVLKDLLDSRKTDRAIVVGNSFGAAIAIEFAASFPESTRLLVLVNGGYVPALPKFMRKLISLPALEKPFRALIRKATYSDKALAKAFPKPSKLPSGFIDQIRTNEEKQSRVVFDTILNHEKPQVPPSVPVAMIWGTGDRLLSMNQLKTLRKWLGNAKFVPIENAGHMPQVERPEEFVAAMRRLNSEEV